MDLNGLKKVIIIGTKSLGEITLDLCHDLSLEVIGFIDDFSNEKKAFGYTIIGNTSDLKNPDFQNSNIIVAIGSNEGRRSISKVLKNTMLNFPNIVHPKAYLANSAKLGHGNILFPNSYIGTSSTLGNFNLVFPCSCLNHHNKVGDFNFLGPGSLVGGETRLRDNTKLGMNSVIDPYQDLASDMIFPALTTYKHEREL